MSEHEKLKAMQDEMLRLHPAIDRYYEICAMAQELKEKLRLESIKFRYSNLQSETEYEECEYPAMGVSPVDGCATFSSKVQAESLTEILNERTDYYRVYCLKWDGPGRYRQVPSYRVDHDGENIYMANFVRCSGE